MTTNHRKAVSILASSLVSSLLAFSACGALADGLGSISQPDSGNARQTRGITSYSVSVGSMARAKKTTRTKTQSKVKSRKKSKSTSGQNACAQTQTCTPASGQNACAQTQTCAPASGKNACAQTQTCAPASQSKAAVGHYTIGSSSSQEKEAGNYVNEDRQAQGLAALPMDETLCGLARLKSQDMAENNYFAHTSPTLGNASSMLRSYSYSFNAVGENIARYGSVAKAHAGLMSSEGHRKNILGANWTRMGIGIVQGANGSLYITQLFVR